MMRINTEIYPKINRVCSLLCCSICVGLGLVGCSPKEAEVLWTNETVDVQSTEKAEEYVALISEEATYSCETVESTTVAEEQKSILVHVCGAVMNPGVVELPIGSRARDALEAAGGFCDDASWDYVNLAAEVLDGQQLFFPTVEEVDSMEHLDMNQGLGANSSVVSSQTGKVNINTADESVLCTLPGIGTSKAQAIIAYRQENGPFVTTQDIMKVSGIKASAYEKIQDKIIVQ